MTQTTSSQPTDQQRSRISFWGVRKADSKATHTGKIELTQQMVTDIQQLQPNEYGKVQLKVVLFDNDSHNPKAPVKTGYVDLDDSTNPPF